MLGRLRVEPLHAFPKLTVASRLRSLPAGRVSTLAGTVGELGARGDAESIGAPSSVALGALVVQLVEGGLQSLGGPERDDLTGLEPVLAQVAHHLAVALLPLELVEQPRAVAPVKELTELLEGVPLTPELLERDVVLVEPQLEARMLHDLVEQLLPCQLRALGLRLAHFGNTHFRPPGSVDSSGSVL